MPTVEYGVQRQVWFAPADDPSDKNSFLIRDDAYSRREAAFGRNVRLGDPVDLGPFGAWRQKNWSGGYDQESWHDERMYELGTADASDRKGSVKLWNGFHEIHSDGRGLGSSEGDPAYRLLQPGAWGTGDDGTLTFFTGRRRVGTPPSNYYMYKYVPSTGAVTLLKTWAAQPEAVGLVGDRSGSTSGMALIGFSNGEVWTWDQTSDTFTQEQVAGGGSVGYKSIVAFNDATFYTKGTDLWRRAGGQTTLAKSMNELYAVSGMSVWNNRMWFLGHMSQGRTGVFVSDGYTVQLAFIVPGNFMGIETCGHYGSLYIRGVVDRAGGTVDTRQQVWRYNGASVTLLWEDDESDLDFEYEGGLCSWGRYLVWSKHGSDAFGRNPGVWLYDAEDDSIFVGPTIEMDPDSNGVLCTSITPWNNTLAVGFVDLTTYPNGTVETPRWLGYLEKSKKPRAIKLDGTSSVDQDPVANTVTASFSNQSFAYPQTTKSQVILSSQYDGGLAGETKVWVKGYVRCRVPEGCQVRIALIHDDDLTEHPIQTIAYDSSVGPGWRNVQFSAECATHGGHEQSSKVRYKLYVENVDLANFPNNTAEVDVVGLDFLPSPSRRSIYHVRVVATDGQTTLAGTANPLTTRDAIVGKLQEYWEAAVPVLFWPPTASGATPSGPGTPVMLNDYIEQSFRVDTLADDVVSEVSFNLLEVA